MRWIWIIGVVAIAGWLIVGCGVDTGKRYGWLKDPFSYYPGITPPGGSGGGGGGVPGSNPGNYDQQEQEVFDLVNQERQNAGRSPLEWCDGLADLARCHSHDMCDRGFFDHVNPEGEDPTDRGRAGHAGQFTCDPIVPNPYYGIAENIAYGYNSPQSVMQAWMNSRGHRANILNGNYTHIGVGNCGTDLQGHTGCGTHWTQNFGTRLNP